MRLLYRCACFYCANTLPDFSPALLVYDDEANYLASYWDGLGWLVLYQTFMALFCDLRIMYTLKVS